MSGQFNHLMEGPRFQGVNKDHPIHYFEDYTRVELKPFGDEGEQFGTVIHDLGGENVPVYIDGKNDPTMPNDYTLVPRDQIHASWAAEQDQ